MWANIWDDLDLLVKVGRWIPYVFIVLGFLVAISGQFVRGFVDERITQLRQAAELGKKQTPPNLDAQVAVSDKGSLLVVIDVKNEIPFQSRWLVVTEKDKVVSGLMIQDAEFHPSPSRMQWQHKLNINKEEVVNDYLELRLDYWSVYSAELNHPQQLRGKIIRRYKLVDGAPHLLNLLPMDTRPAQDQAASS